MPPTSTLGSSAAVRQQPAGQRRRRRLAVRAGDDDRARAPQKVLADRFGQRAVANLAIEHLFELGIAARDRVADDHQIEIAGDVLGAGSRPASECLRRPGSRSSADRRPDRSRGRRALALQHRRERRHRRAADADEMDLACSLNRRLLDDEPRRGAGDDAARRRRTAASSPDRRCGPEGKPISTGPGKSREQIGHDRARRSDRPTARRTAAARR